MGGDSMGKVDDPKSSSDTLGAHLLRLRNAAGLSLRQVEDATDNEVSNAYLSQLENNRISKPSPNILHALARVYQTPYEDLMVRAGYLSSEPGTQDQKRTKVAPFAIQGLTNDEEQALIEYLAFLRKQRRK
jgi:transcriptional regulator with XRE-family HTH domain